MPEPGCTASSMVPPPPRAGGEGIWLVPKACEERATWLCPKGWEVQHCSPSPSRGLGWHWVRHSGGVPIEEGTLGFQECLEGVHSQTTVLSEARGWKVPSKVALSVQADGGPRPPTSVWAGVGGSPSCGPEEELPGLHPARSTGQPLSTSHLPLGQLQGGWRLPLPALGGVGTTGALSSDSQESPEGH